MTISFIYIKIALIVFASAGYWLLMNGKKEKYTSCLIFTLYRMIKLRVPPAGINTWCAWLQTLRVGSKSVPGAHCCWKARQCAQLKNELQSPGTGKRPADALQGLLAGHCKYV